MIARNLSHGQLDFVGIIQGLSPVSEGNFGDRKLYNLK